MNVPQAAGLALILLAAASHPSPAANPAQAARGAATAPLPATSAEKHFDLAAKAFAAKAYARAAHEIRLGEDFVARQASALNSAFGRVKRVLLQSASTARRG